MSNSKITLKESKIETQSTLHQLPNGFTKQCLISNVSFNKTNDNNNAKNDVYITNVHILLDNNQYMNSDIIIIIIYLYGLIYYYYFYYNRNQCKINEK